MSRVLAYLPMAVVFIIGAAVGAVVYGIVGPFVIDAEFWVAFTTGPPMAGIFAVVAALIALAAAWRSAKVARYAAARQEWWDRAEWALDLARSSTQVERLIGLRALEGLRDDATRGELKMIVAVQNAVIPAKEADVATTTVSSDHAHARADPASEPPLRATDHGLSPEHNSRQTPVDSGDTHADTRGRRFKSWLKRKLG